MYDPEDIEIAVRRRIPLPAWLLQLQATAVSAVEGHPGFIPDGYLRGLTGNDLDHPDADPVLLAGVLCAAGLWEQAEGGYRVLDAEAVQTCADRVRELREAAAGGGKPVPGPERPAGTAVPPAAGVTRFGARTAQGTAVSFRCAACGELAGVVKVARAGTLVAMGAPLADETCGRDGLVVDYFLGTAWHGVSPAVLEEVQALIDAGPVEPASLREVSWELAPFHCPDCGLNYCAADWDTRVLFDEGCYDRTMGTCPNGHEHMVDD